MSPRDLLANNICFEMISRKCLLCGCLLKLHAGHKRASAAVAVRAIHFPF